VSQYRNEWKFILANLFCLFGFYSPCTENNGTLRFPSVPYNSFSDIAHTHEIFVDFMLKETDNCLN